MKDTLFVTGVSDNHLALARFPISSRNKRIIELQTENFELKHATRRMLQALDGYWLHCDGLPYSKETKVRGRYELEDWWNRFEKYRKEVERLLNA